MIERDDRMLLDLLVPRWRGHLARLNALIARAKQSCRRAARALSLRPCRWVVTTNVVCVDDVSNMYRLTVSLPGCRPRRSLGMLGRWCDAHCRGRFRQVDHNRWVFAREDDAKRFDVFWGAGKESPDYKPFNRRQSKAA